MATLVSGTSFALRMDELDLTILLEGDVVTANSSNFTLGFSDGFREIFTGFGFAYDAFGTPAAGTITGYQETLNGITTFTITGAEVPVTPFLQAVESGSTLNALNLIFSGNDNVYGSRFDDVFGGLAGHDNLFGGEGSDSMDGGLGNDHLYGQSASGGVDAGDLIYGGDGSDYLQGNAGNDSLSGDGGSDRIFGGQGNDSIRGADGSDSINGNLGDDSIDGGDGNDSLRGGQGNDYIIGATGNDVIFGDLGNDTLLAGYGVDVLSGGQGADVFKFEASAAEFADTGDLAFYLDTITDFEDSIDKIAVGYVPQFLGAMNANSVQEAVALARAAASNDPGGGEAVAVQVGNDAYLFYATGISGGMTSGVHLVNVSALSITADDIVI